MKIVIIIPTYNEKDNIEKMIPVLEKDILPKIENHEIQILIADDASPDGTRDVVASYMKQYKNIHLLVGEKKGLGAAYARAMRYAMDKMDAYAVIEFDADFQHDPHDIPRLIHAMDDGADYVIGSRYVKGGGIPKEWGLDRKLLSNVGGFIARVIWLNFSIHDMTSGFKLTKTEFLKKVNLENLYSNTFAYKLHILHDVVKYDAKVKEVPIIFYERSAGQSKINKKESFESLYVVLRLRADDSKRVIQFLFVGGSGFLLQIFAQELSIRSGFTSLLGNIAVLFGGQNTTVLSHSIGAGIGAEVAILSNFMFNNIWTFKDTHTIKGRSPMILRLFKFNLASLASIFIQFLSVGLGEKILGTQFYVFGFPILTRIAILFPVIIFIVLPMNYFIYNRFIWKTHHLMNKRINE